MPVMITKNRGDVAKEGTIVTHDVANATYVVVGNNTVSNLNPSAGQNVESASITSIVYGAQTGAHWTISRGANLVAVAVGTGRLSFDGATINKDPTANLVVALQGGTVGFIMVEMKTKTT